MGIDAALILSSLAHQKKRVKKKIKEKEINEEFSDLSEIQCPECRRFMNTIDLSNDLIVESCSFCRGLWFNSDELKEITGSVNDIPSQHLKDRPSRFECPQCSIKMKEFVFKAPDNILVDSCTHCHGIYLERNELKRIFKLLDN